MMLSVQELTNSCLAIKSEKIKRAVLTALADSEMVKILDAAMYQSKSVIQIVRETGVSHTTAYRKIKWLVEEKLLIIDKTEIAQDGKKFSLFRTILKSFNVKYEYNKVVIEAEQNLDTIRKITENFFSLSEREGFQQVKMGNLEL
jgi:DNA-binding transcriptional ArsR family regulator